MTNQAVTLRNVETGLISVVPRKWAENPRIVNPKFYVVVADGSKPYVEELYTPRTREEFVAQHPDKVIEPVDSEADDQEDEEYPDGE